MNKSRKKELINKVLSDTDLGRTGYPISDSNFYNLAKEAEADGVGKLVKVKMKLDSPKTKSQSVFVSVFYIADAFVNYLDDAEDKLYFERFVVTAEDIESFYPGGIEEYASLLYLSMLGDKCNEGQINSSIPIEEYSRLNIEHIAWFTKEMENALYDITENLKQKHYVLLSDAKTDDITHIYGVLLLKGLISLYKEDKNTYYITLTDAAIENITGGCLWTDPTLYRKIQTIETLISLPIQEKKYKDFCKKEEFSLPDNKNLSAAIEKEIEKDINAFIKANDAYDIASFRFILLAALNQLIEDYVGSYIDSNSINMGNTDEADTLLKKCIPDNIDAVISETFESLIEYINDPESFIEQATIGASDEESDENEDLDSQNSNDDVEDESQFKEQCKKFLIDYTPAKVLQYLDDSIVGQTEAKKTCIITIFKQIYNVISEDEEKDANNLLIAGPTGCGKTKIWKTLSEISPIPIYISDVAGVTPQGYTGENIDKIFADFVGSKYSKAALENSIIVLDEFDKLCKNDSGTSGVAFNRIVQGQFLSIVEGSKIRVSRKKFDTSKMAFVFLGAFEDIQLEQESVSKKAPLGFTTLADSTTGKKDNLSKGIKMDDIIKYGLRSELAGRIGNVIKIAPLSEENMIDIMRKIPKSLVSTVSEQYQRFNVKISIDDDAADKIAKMAFKKKLGARSLKSTLSKIIDDQLFDALGSDSIININAQTIAKYENENL